MILVVGDVIVDVYHGGRIRGVSAESPTLVMLRESSETFVGGAGLVGRHLKNLGKIPYVYTIGSEDDVGQYPIHLIVDERWKISKKERFFVEKYKLFQVDDINAVVHDDASRDSLKSEIRRVIDRQPEAVVVCDNGHGVIDYRIAEFLSDLRHDTRPEFRLIVNSQFSQEPSRYHWFTKADLFCMNVKEFFHYHQKICGCSGTRSDVVEDLDVRHLSKMTGHDLVVTLGAAGSVACIDQSIYRNTPSVIGDIIDTCGAGDAFLSVLASCDWKKYPSSVLQRANDYAARHCTVVGTEVLNYEKDD